MNSSTLSLTIVWSLLLLDFWVWDMVAGGRLGVLETGRGSAERVGARAAASAMQLSLRIMLFVYLSRCVAQRCWRAAVLCYRCTPASWASQRCLLLLSTRRSRGINTKLLSQAAPAGLSPQGVAKPFYGAGTGSLPWKRCFCR